MYEIKKIPFKICDHNPKAQSICYPDNNIDFNQFQKNIRTQLKKSYEITRGSKTKK